MTTKRAEQRTKVRRMAKYVIGDMIERTIHTGIDLSQEADLAGTTEAALIKELERQAAIMFDAGIRS